MNDTIERFDDPEDDHFFRAYEFDELPRRRNLLPRWMKILNIFFIVIGALGVLFTGVFLLGDITPQDRPGVLYFILLVLVGAGGLLMLKEVKWALIYNIILHGFTAFLHIVGGIANIFVTIKTKDLNLTLIFSFFIACGIAEVFFLAGSVGINRKWKAAVNYS